jgi:hypothetical protein
MELGVALTNRPEMEAATEQDAQSILRFLRAHYAGGRAPIFPPLHLCREVIGETGVCGPEEWGRLWRALPMLYERGLVEEAALPQGDPGIRLSPRGVQGG